MKVTDLVKNWETDSKPETRNNDYYLRVPLEDAARVAALSELFPGRNENDILNDMISAALDDVTETRQPKGRGTDRKKMSRNN